MKAVFFSKDPKLEYITEGKKTLYNLMIFIKCLGIKLIKIHKTYIKEQL